MLCVCQAKEKAEQAKLEASAVCKYKLDDPRLCRSFLCGFCPSKEFEFTKTALLLRLSDALGMTV